MGHPEFGKLGLCTCRRSQLSDQARQRLYAVSNLERLSHLTFENFKPRGPIGIPPVQADSLERAYNHARHFAGNLNGWLLLQGAYGSGKTHLAAAIANFVVSLGVPTLFLTVPDLLDQLRFAYQDPETSFEERFEQVREVPLLVMDDFGTQSATQWAQEKLFQIINHRYINHLPTVITTNLELETIEERIASRLQDPQLVTRVRILAPDYRNPTSDSAQARLSALSMLGNLTFSNWQNRRNERLSAGDLKSLDKALRAARDFAEKPTGWLVFAGPSGSGKTHLAAAIANHRAMMGYAVLFVTAADLLDHLRATFNPDSAVRFDRRFEEVRSAALLVLDDLGAQSTTPWAREKLLQIFNYRYLAELPTVITTASGLDEIDPRLRSRLLDTRLCTVHAITAPAFQGEVSAPPPRRR